MLVEDAQRRARLSRGATEVTEEHVDAALQDRMAWTRSRPGRWQGQSALFFGGALLGFGLDKLTDQLYEPRPDVSLVVLATAAAMLGIGLGIFGIHRESSG